MNSESPSALPPPNISARRVLRLLIPAFFSFGLAVLILVWDNYNPPGWQRAMENYLSAYSSSPRAILAEGSADVAQLPFLLSRDTPFQPVTPSVYFQTESLSAAIQPDSPESLGHKPLPYPVMELYCIDLSQADVAAAATRYLVAEHRDLTNSEWIVYRPAEWAVPAAVDKAWKQLGCDPEEE
ncbi:MAG: hypothetical protein WBO46_12280 [Caldilineaceae bacterium]